MARNEAGRAALALEPVQRGLAAGVRVRARETGLARASPVGATSLPTG